MLNQQQLASMTLEQLHEKRKAILKQKEDNAHRWEESESPIGQRMLEAKRNQLEAVRAQYIKIDVKQDIPAELILREFLEKQVLDRQLTDEIALIGAPESRAKELDVELRALDEHIEAREAEKKRGR